MPSQHTTQRPFAMPPTGLNTDWPITDLDAWLADTVLDEGFVCQVSWRERTRMTWQVANFSSTHKGAEFARSLMDDPSRPIFDLLVHSNQPAGPHSPLKAQENSPPRSIGNVMQITLAVAKEIYRKAIDTRASDAEGPAWWSQVADEMHDVIAARTLADAAAVIEWWHHDWTVVSDTPRAAAKRIREAARAIRRNS